MLRCGQLDRHVGATCLLKAENLQQTGAFKVRGALAALTADEAARGLVVTASAGNFGQGVAFGAEQLGRRCLVFVPESTPSLKIARIERLGGSVRRLGAHFDDCERLARHFAGENGFDFLHPFDHARVIEGQATAVRELLAEHPSLDVLVVPCGGGGLLAGAVLACDEARRSPRLVAVEPTRLPSLAACSRNDRPVAVESARSLADGIAVRRVGELPWRRVRGRLDRVVTVSEKEIAAAIHFLAVETKQIVEGAGAAAVAALLAQPDIARDARSVGVLVTGGNIDSDVLARVLGAAG